jgi:hypothetical protein
LTKWYVDSVLDKVKNIRSIDFMTNMSINMNMEIHGRKCLGNFAVTPNTLNSAEYAERLRCILSI